MAVAAVSALAAVACGGGDTIVNPGSSAVTGISVSGTGRATAEPDLVLLQLGIEVEREHSRRRPRGRRRLSAGDPRRLTGQRRR